MLNGVSLHYFTLLLFILVAVCYLILGIYTLLADMKSKVRWMYMFAIISLTFWSLFYGLMMISNNEPTARVFFSIGLLFSCLFFPSWIHFLLYLIDSKHKDSKCLGILYTFAIIIPIIGIHYENIYFAETPFGFLYSYGENIVFRIMTIYLVFLFFIIAYLHYKWWKLARSEKQKKYIMRFVTITLLIAPLGFILEFIGPAFFGIKTIPISSGVILIVSLQLAYIMHMYSSLSISVKNISEDIFKSISMPIFLLNIENYIIHINDAAASVWGNDYIGKNAVTLFLVDNKPPEATLFDADFTEKTVTAESRTYDMLLKVLTDKHGEVFSKIVAFNDITEMQNALAFAKDQSKAKGEFLSRMSHEMRTPMNAIIGMANIGRNANDPQKINNYLDKIVEASNHLLDVINDVLDMSKIEANKMEIITSSFNLDVLIERVKSIAAIKAYEKSHKLSFNIDNNIPRSLIGDNLRLAQVMANFLSNAIKFTPDGGHIDLNINLIKKVDNELTIRVEVKDTGIGISPDHFEKLFSSFEQAEGDTDRKYGGTGLGLSISKRIIELMGGSIGVASEKGNGSCFYFIIKLQLSNFDENNLNSIEDEINLDGAFKGKNILLVEDIEINREIVITILEDTGVEIDKAENGIIALEMFEKNENKYDLIFMDIQMPYMNGLEATTKIRSINSDYAKNIPIIAMTANAFAEDVLECKNAGMNDHIRKPIDFDDVLKKLHVYLS